MNRIARMFLATLILATCLPSTAISQQNKIDRETETPSQPLTAQVIVDGHVLFSVRGISAFPAEERARAIEERIVAVAIDHAFATENLSIEQLENQTDIKAGDRVVMSVVEADALVEGGSVPREILAAVNLKKIAEVIKSYRTDRTRSALLSKAYFSAGAFVALAALMFLLVRLFRWLEHLIATRYKSRIQGIDIQSLRLVQGEQLWLAVRGVLSMLRTLSILALVISCVEYVLRLYPWTRHFANRTILLVLGPLRRMADSVVESIPNLLFLIVLILVARYILKLARLLFASVESGSVTWSGFDPTWALPTYKVFRVMAIAFTLVIAYPYIPGSDSEAFKGVSLFVGLVFSLGSTSFVANTIAGYGMIYRRAFRIGDRVQIGNHVGDVLATRLQVTHLRTIKNEEIIVPNSEILGSPVVNYSTLAKTGGLILHTTVGIGYETPWRQVESMLLMAAERTEGLLRQPTPFVHHKSLGDFCVVYEINAYCSNPQASEDLYTDLHRNILDVFNEYDIQIMTPAYEGDPVEAKVVPRDKWFAPPALPPDQNSRK